MGLSGADTTLAVVVVQAGMLLRDLVRQLAAR